MMSDEYLFPRASTFYVSQYQMGYAAAMVDGEGSIGVYIHINKDGHRQMTTVLTIVNTDRRVIQWFQDTFGGGHIITKPAKGKRRRRWDWKITNNRAVELLKQLRPLLMLKGEQADLLIQLQETRSNGWGRQGAPASLWHHRQHMVDELKRLKRA